LADHAQHARQLFRPDRDQRDHADHDEFAPADAEHGNSTPPALRQGGHLAQVA
jgi:hypothetical protein